MLLEENKVVSRVYLADKYGVDLKKLEKHPSFELDKSKVSKDKANGGVVKVNAGTSIRSHFYATDPKTGTVVEIKYAKGRQEKNVGDKRYTEYSPRYVKYFKDLQDGGSASGTKFSHQDDLDLALYFALHPQNKFSPLRDKNKKGTVGYEFIDTKARALDKMTSLNKTAEAMEHARNVDSFNLVIMAKGFGFQKVDSKEEDTLRADLLEFALKKPDAYLSAVHSGIVHTEGLIINLIDRGVLSLEKIHGIRQWKWTSGEREGEVVGSQITNPSQDAKAFIKTYILNNIHTYHPILNSVSSTLNAKEKAKEFFKSQQAESDTKVIGNDLPEHLRSVNADSTIVTGNATTITNTGLPTNFNEAREYVAERGYNKAPAKIKAFLNAIEANEIDITNAAAFLRELYAPEED